MVQLKAFQRLGYFPNPEDLPDFVVKHLRSALRFKDEIFLLVIPKTLYRHRPRAGRQQCRRGFRL